MEQELEQVLYNSSPSTVPEATNLSITPIGHLRRHVMEGINLNLVSHKSALVEFKYCTCQRKRSIKQEIERESLTIESMMTNISIWKDAVLVLPWSISQIMHVSPLMKRTQSWVKWCLQNILLYLACSSRIARFTALYKNLCVRLNQWNKWINSEIRWFLFRFHWLFL